MWFLASSKYNDTLRLVEKFVQKGYFTRYERTVAYLSMRGLTHLPLRFEYCCVDTPAATSLGNRRKTTTLLFAKNAKRLWTQLQYRRSGGQAS